MKLDKRLLEYSDHLCQCDTTIYSQVNDPLSRPSFGDILDTIQDVDCDVITRTDTLHYVSEDNLERSHDHSRRTVASQASLDKRRSRKCALASAASLKRKNSLPGLKGKCRLDQTDDWPDLDTSHLDIVSWFPKSKWDRMDCNGNRNRSWSQERLEVWRLLTEIWKHSGFRICRIWNVANGSRASEQA